MTIEKIHTSPTNLSETEALASALAQLLHAGDIIALEGDLGAGKSAFARALIRSYFSMPSMEVPSPTFTIVQSYEPDTTDSNKVALWHADLYRLSDSDELYELGLDEALEDHVLIVEWPDRMQDAWRAAALTLKFEILPAADDIEDQPRSIQLLAPPSWHARLKILKDSL